jgi:hypothetical protein
MYPPTLTIFSWQAGAWRACIKLKIQIVCSKMYSWADSKATFCKNPQLQFQILIYYNYQEMFSRCKWIHPLYTFLFNSKHFIVVVQKSEVKHVYPRKKKPLNALASGTR